MRLDGLQKEDEMRLDGLQRNEAGPRHRGIPSIAYPEQQGGAETGGETWMLCCVVRDMMIFAEIL